METPAGWYSDTNAPGIERYWDGTWWTAETRTTPPPPPPPPPPPDAPGRASETTTTVTASAFVQATGAFDEAGFRAFCEDALGPRARTADALFRLACANKICLNLMAQAIGAHEASREPEVVRVMLLGGTKFYGIEALPALQAVGDAAREDFEALRKEMLHVRVGGMSEEQMWANYLAPLMHLTKDLCQPLESAMIEVAAFEDLYLRV